MSRLFVLGHGSDPDLGETFVPAGVVLHFHSEVDKDGLLSLFAETLATGAAKGSVMHYGAGEHLPNYLLVPVEDATLALALAVVKNESELTFVGDERGILGGRTFAYLCTGLQDCEEEGEHYCEGLLGLLKHKSYDEIHILACRSEWDESDAPVTLIVGGEQAGDEFNYYYRVHSDAEVLLTMADMDAERGTDRAGEYFDALTYEDQALLLSVGHVLKWSYVRQAKKFLATQDPQFPQPRTFYHFYLGQNREEQTWYEEDPVLKQAVEQARTYYGSWFLRAPEKERRQWWDDLTKAVREDLLNANDDLRIWVYPPVQDSPLSSHEEKGSSDEKRID